MDPNSVRTVYVPVVMYVPVPEGACGLNAAQLPQKIFNDIANMGYPQPKERSSDTVTNLQFNMTEYQSKRDNSETSSSRYKCKIKTNLVNKQDIQNIRNYSEPYPKNGSNRVRVPCQTMSHYNTISPSHCESSKNCCNKKRKSGQSYYPSAFISNPCDQLFGPQPLDCSTSSEKTEIDCYEEQSNKSFNKKIKKEDVTECKSTEYIPTPRWNKTQSAMLEEFYKKGRFPKTLEIKAIAQKLNVMDTDVEEWFRKRRGRDRKTKRKNENLRSLIDKYLVE